MTRVVWRLLVAVLLGCGGRFETEPVDASVDDGGPDDAQADTDDAGWCVFTQDGGRTWTCPVEHHLTCCIGESPNGCRLCWCATHSADGAILPVPELACVWPASACFESCWLCDSSGACTWYRYGDPAWHDP